MAAILLSFLAYIAIETLDHHLRAKWVGWGGVVLSCLFLWLLVIEMVLVRLPTFRKMKLTEMLHKGRNKLGYAIGVVALGVAVDVIAKALETKPPGK